jgi:hypothetical protein
MKRGSYIVNTARGKICDTNAIADALKSGQLAGYAGTSLVILAARQSDTKVMCGSHSQHRRITPGDRCHGKA